MKRIRAAGLYGVAAFTGIALVFAACGSGGGSGNKGTASVTVSIDPPSATLVVGGAQQFTATVSGTTNVAVNWAVQEGGSGGSISVDGLYTAPSTPGAFHVRATSVSDTSKSATATVTVTEVSLTIDEFYDGLNSATASLVECGYGAFPELAARLAVGPSLGGLPAPAIAEMKKGIAAGRIKYDGVKAKACLEKMSLDPRHCWGPDAPQLNELGIGSVVEGFNNSVRFGRAFAECYHVFAGLVSDGGACYSSADCASTSCDANGDNCPGKCSVRLQEGADCSCPGGACPPYCAAGLSCSSIGSAWICTRPVSLGAACPSSGCPSGLQCVAGVCAQIGLAQGSKCQVTFDATEDECDHGLWCARTLSGQESGSCQPRVDAGGDCYVYGALANGHGGIGSPQCKGNQACINVSVDAQQHVVPGKCASPQDVGGTCTPTLSRPSDAGWEGCLVGLICDSATSRCVKPPRAGSPCLVGGLCDSSVAYCSGARCTSLGEIGQQCSLRNQCAYGLDCEPATGTCQPCPEVMSGSCRSFAMCHES